MNKKPNTKDIYDQIMKERANKKKSLEFIEKEKTPEVRFEEANEMLAKCLFQNGALLVKYDEDFDKDTMVIESHEAFTCFHSDVWPNLSMGQKMVSICWANNLLSSNRLIPPFKISFDINLKEFASYIQDRDKNKVKYCFNPLLFDKMNVQDFILGFILKGVEVKLQNAINNYIEHGVLKEDIGLVELAGFSHPINEPKSYDNFLNGKKITSQQLKQCLIYTQQPVNDLLQADLDLLKEFISMANEKVGNIDEQWEEDLNRITDDFAETTRMFKQHILNGDVKSFITEQAFKESKRAMYSKIYKDSINLLKEDRKTFIFNDMSEKEKN